MSRVKSLFRNFKLLFTDDLIGRLETRDSRFDQRSDQLSNQLDELRQRVEARADAYESAVDMRIDERLAASETALDERISAFEQRSDARTDVLEGAVTTHTNEFKDAITVRVNEFESTLTQRANNFEAAINQRATEFEQAINERITSYETALDARLEARFLAAERRLDSRMADVEMKLDAGLERALKTLNEQFNERARTTDMRVDDRFNILEQRTDARLETFERTVDGKLHQRSQDIIDRTDLMLQIFEQRIDKLRRDLRAIRTTSTNTAPNSNAALMTSEPHEQMISFRKLAETSAQLKKSAAEQPALYHQILAWKKNAHEGIYDFSSDEQEIAAYILSFQTDPKEIAYVKHHMRRLLATLHRIPPAQSANNRLLELGSLLHIAPAICKYYGYTEVVGADYWTDDEKVITETLRQKDGSDSYTFELRNFNVETDTFPYPDNFFRTILCCELIEHLQRDPMHMLWECNRVLAPDGYLLLTTPNIASCRAIEGVLTGCTPYHFSQYNIQDIADQHNREYSPYEVQWALEAAGFTVIEIETEDVWLRSNPAILGLLKQLQFSTELRGDNIFALARKTSAPVERYPKSLYAIEDNPAT